MEKTEEPQKPIPPINIKFDTELFDIINNNNNIIQATILTLKYFIEDIFVNKKTPNKAPIVLHKK